MNNKVALITGSTSGIGKGIAEKFASLGYHIVLNGFGDAAEIKALQAQLIADHKVQVIYQGADLSQPEQITRMMKAVLNELGSIDILVNNAGVQHVSPIEDFPIDKWNLILALNLSASFHTIRLAVPEMKKRAWGRIINIASAHALVASPFKSAYVAAKHGIAGLTKTVALEVAESGITVNAICPGYVWTPLVEKQIPDTAKARGMSEQEVIDQVMLKAQPTKKFVSIEQVADLAAYLASDTAAAITGSMLSIDGGWTAQ